MRLLPLLLVALLAGCAGSEPAGPPTVWGVWEGEGAQWNDGDRSHEPDVRWPLEIAVTPAASGEPTATIDYPSFPCGGTLEYVGPSREPDALPGDMVFLERITYGGDACVSGGTVLLRPDARGLVYAWAIDTSPTVATARLRHAD